MGTLIHFPRTVCSGSDSQRLLHAYRQVIGEAYNRTVDIGRYDRHTANVMTGFLSAATVALRPSGQEPWAARFEQAGHRLNEDWTCYQTEVVALCAAIDGQVVTGS